MDNYVTKYKNKDGYTVYKIASTSCCGNKIEWLRGESPAICPFCQSPYYRKPNLEMKLFTLQDDFLSDFNKTGSTRILGEKMFPLIQEYAKNFIKRMIRGKTSLEGDELEVRSWDAATTLVEVIMKEPDHKMRYSFGDYLSRICKSVCYSTQNHDRTYSLNSLLQNSQTEVGATITVNLEDLSNGRETGVIKVNTAVDDDEYNENIINKFLNIIETSERRIFSTTKSTATCLLYLQGLLFKFNKREAVSIKFMSWTSREVKDYIEKGEKLLLTAYKDWENEVA